MSDFDWAKTSGGRAAIGAFVLSLLLFAYSLVHAVRIDAVPVQSAPDFASASALAAPVRGAEGDVDAAVEADLFAADRSAPARTATAFRARMTMSRGPLHHRCFRSCSAPPRPIPFMRSRPCSSVKATL